ncbi:MAG: hypothetical protein UV77_C0018G0003 [Candidatus Nomurabacteria bacterium GW2011_GWA1_43_17]|nr:MAG: hypothetical protein UV77_C0018G0003 [Candidatus Nomurabacteria bacterium GW2011_GWA1_43_17]
MEMEPKDTSFEVFSHIKKHYYGDTVRRFFFTGDVIMLLTLAFFRDRANFPIVLSIFAMVLIGFLAGFINPKQKIIIFFIQGLASLLIMDPVRDQGLMHHICKIMKNKKGFSNNPTNLRKRTVSYL